MTQVTNKHIIWVLIALVGLYLAKEAYLATEYFGADYLAFDRQRAAWHQRCDAVILEPARPEIQVIQDSCHRELKQMLAYGTHKGW